MAPGNINGNSEAMLKPPKRATDPLKVFASAEHFHHTLRMLRSRMIEPEMIAIIAQPSDGPLGFYP
jgi:hypothetical protein